MVPSACRFWLRICSSLKSKGTKIPSVWAGSSSVVCWLGKACSPMKLVVFSFLPTSTKDQLFFSLFFLFPPEGRRPEYQPPAFSPDRQSCPRTRRRDDQSRVSCRNTQGHDTHQSWGNCPQKQPDEEYVELLPTHPVHHLQSGTAWHQGRAGRPCLHLPGMPCVSCQKQSTRPNLCVCCVRMDGP